MEQGPLEAGNSDAQSAHGSGSAGLKSTPGPRNSQRKRVFYLRFGPVLELYLWSEAELGGDAEEPAEQGSVNCRE
jgi:hypothetical protein